MSPPLVVAFALAGRVDIDMSQRAARQGQRRQGRLPARHLADAARKSRDVDAHARSTPETSAGSTPTSPSRTRSGTRSRRTTGKVYEWDAKSTYIQEPPFFDDFGMQSRQGRATSTARAPLAIFGDSVTTDHISPAGAIKTDLARRAVPAWRTASAVEDFNSYGSRRGNDRVMTRGTFANVRIKNLMVPGVEGGVTVHQPDGERMSIYDAAMKYQAARHAAGRSSPGRSTAPAAPATGPPRARSCSASAPSSRRASSASTARNLVGMGVLPLPVQGGHERADARPRRHRDLRHRRHRRRAPPRQDATLRHPPRGRHDARTSPVTLRIDTPIEVDYYRARRDPAVRPAAVDERVTRLRGAKGPRVSFRQSGWFGRL